MNVVSTAVNPETLKNVALGLSGASLILAIVMLKVIRSIVGRVVSTVLLVALALAGWSQRASIVDCVDRVKSGAAAGAVTCTFFGQDVTVEVPSTPK